MKHVLFLLIAGAAVSGIAAYTAGVARPASARTLPTR
jgi:hypothetical protein